MTIRSPLRVVAGLSPEGLPLVRRAVRAGLGYVFGPPGFDRRSAPGDPGLFGPGSPSWRLIAEPAAIIGGVRALLVQLLHPHAVAGVVDHSGFRDAPLDRLRRTSAYVTVTTFGATGEAIAAARAVRRVHRGVRGVAPDGRPYAADDPHLLAWVQIALTSSFLATDRAYAPRPLPPEDADRFVREQSSASALLDPRVDLDAVDPSRLAELPMVRDGLLPTSVDELDAALERYRPELRLDPEGHRALRFLLWPDIDPLVRAGYLPMVAGAVASLEPWQRRILGVRVGRLAPRVTVAQTRALVGAMRIAIGRSPSLRAATERATARSAS